MATSIMDAMHEHVNPTTVSNALYEMMVEWFSCVTMQITADTKSQRRKFDDKRRWTEVALGRFFNQDALGMRALLEEHYGVRVPERRV